MDNNYNIAIDNNGTYRVCSRDVAKEVGYSHTQVIKHIDKLRETMKEHLFLGMYLEDTFQIQNSIPYRKYWISGKGLGWLKDIYPRYTSSLPIAYELYYRENESERPVEITKSLPIQTPIEDDLKNENGQIVVSSRDVAVRFGKEHKHVLRDIENLKNSTAQNWTLYFIQSSYKASNGKTNPEYLLTRDGFTLLAFGFTGKEALQFKLAYIEAFNKMEEKLKEVNHTFYQENQFTLPNNFKEALVMLIAEVEAKEQLQVENKEQQQKIEYMKPKTEFCEDVLEADGAMPVTVIAKDYGMSASKMNELLHNLGIQFKLGKGNRWVLYAEHQDKGYATSETGVNSTRYGNYSYTNLKWTQKGRMFIYEMLKEKGILPLIEFHTNQHHTMDF